MGHKTKLVIRLAIGKKTKNPKNWPNTFIQHFDPHFFCTLCEIYSCYIILYVKFTTPPLIPISTTQNFSLLYKHKIGLQFKSVLLDVLTRTSIASPPTTKIESNHIICLKNSHSESQQQKTSPVLNSYDGNYVWLTNVIWYLYLVITRE